jgi:hypothetical protein
MIPTCIGREDSDRRSARRHRRLRAATVGAILVTALMSAASMTAAQVPSSRPSTPLAFEPVEVADVTAPMVVEQISPDPEHASAGRLVPASDVADFMQPQLDADAERAAFGQPDVAPEADARAQSKLPPLPPTKVRARGTATWFCQSGVSSCHHSRSGGMYAAAGAEIRKGDWRGRTVTVCAGDDCIRVTLIDWCGCPGNRVIDLYGDAFRKLAPLGKGIVPVTVRW